MTVRHVSMFSGGIGSWAASRRIVEQFGPDNLTLLHTDTMSEHPEMYRFMTDAAADIGVPVTRVADGRNIWEVFRDERFLGNSRVAPCTSKLKQAVRDKWLKENCDPAETVCYVGIDWTEEHRFIGSPNWPAPNSNPGLRRTMAAKGWRFEAPMCEPPPMAKWQMKKWAVDRGLRLSESYDLGLGHDNCGGGVRQGRRRALGYHVARSAGVVSCLRAAGGGPARPLGEGRVDPHGDSQGRRQATDAATPAQARGVRRVVRHARRWRVRVFR